MKNMKGTYKDESNTKKKIASVISRILTHEAEKGLRGCVNLLIYEPEIPIDLLINKK